MDHAGYTPIMTEPSGQQGRPPAALVTVALLLALGLGWLGGSNAYRVLEFLYKPNQLPGGSCSTHPRSATELGRVLINRDCSAIANSRVHVLRNAAAR